MKKCKSLLLVSTVILMIAVLSLSALASSGSVTDQMAANSAAWWIAYNAGDTATCNALHDANNALANQAAGSSGSASFNPDSGSWTITNSSGTTTSSSSSNGKSNTATYTTTDNSGAYTSSSSSSYTDSSIAAYMANGGTDTGLQNSYNNAASNVSATGNYGDNMATTTADNEVAIAKQVLGLTDTQAAQLKADLEKAKANYDLAHEQYNIAVASGNTTAAEAAQSAMNSAHDAAQGVRASYNYSGDSDTAQDGGYYYGGSTPSGTSGGGYFIVDITPTYTITGSAGVGGTISPAGNQSVAKGGSITFTIAPNSEYKIADVIVDGTSVGAVASYTFSNVTAGHTISAAFEPSGHVSISSTGLYDVSGASLNGNSIKSGYGFFATINADYGDVHNVTVTAMYNFGPGVKSVTLAEPSSGVFQFPSNTESTQLYRCVYIPVETQDGTYTITFTITAMDAAGNTLTDTKTNTITIKGNMYQDDATGDS
jgi:hypothetical protein